MSIYYIISSGIAPGLLQNAFTWADGQYSSIGGKFVPTWNVDGTKFIIQARDNFQNIPQPVQNALERGDANYIHNRMLNNPEWLPSIKQPDDLYDQYLSGTLNTNQYIAAVQARLTS